MYKRTTSLLALALLSSLAALGCSENAHPPAVAPTPAEVRDKISSDLGNVLRETEAAFTINTETLPGWGPVDIVWSLLDLHFFGSDLRSMPAQLVAHGSGPLPAAPSTAIDQDAVISRLNGELFTDANYLGNGIYQVPPSLVCEHSDACANMMALARLRIHTASEGDALVFTIRLDSFDEEPVSFRLTHTSLTTTLDLDEMQHTLPALASRSSRDLPNAALSGKLTGKLEILGSAQAQVSLTIDRAISIKNADPGVDLDSNNAFSFSSAEAEVFSITVDGTANRGSLAVGFNETVVKIPHFNAGRRLEIDLPGLTLTASFAKDQPLQLTNIGLGHRSTTFSINGERAWTVDLNPNDGRTFDETVSRDPATEAETVSVTPTFDLQIAVNRAVVGGEPPVYDVTRVLLTGSLRHLKTTDQVEVVNGSFSIQTAPASYGFTATAGQCVTSIHETDPSTGKSFIRWIVETCQ